MSSQFPLSGFRIEAGKYTFRLLNGDDSDVVAYRDLRDRIRAGEGARYFADSFTREDANNKDENNRPREPAQVLALWRDWCTAKRKLCILGTFDNEKEGNKLIGIMMITAQGPSDSKIAEWEATWVEPGYRKTRIAGLTHSVAGLGYETVHALTRILGFEHAAVYIREGNVTSRTIREGQGFIRIGRHSVNDWGDGKTADADLLLLDLRTRPEAEHPDHWAISRLETTLESMGNEVPFLGDAIQHRIAALREGRTQSLWLGHDAAMRPAA